MLTDKQMFDRMKNGWRMGQPFTVCGNGSRMVATRHIREWLPMVCRDLGIKSMNDAGAGDLKWINIMRRDSPYAIAYYPFDLIPRRPEVKAIDITRDVLPKADAILCRMVLNHLDDERINMALARFKESEARYLFATHFIDGGELRDRQFERVDLVSRLGEPLHMSPDGTEANCRLALWQINP